MKIAIVVHGRFHAFDLARALLQCGHDVVLLTNYPKWAVERFNFPPDRVRSFWVHGVLTRVVQRLHRNNIVSYPEQRLHEAFGRWAAVELRKEVWDVVHPWSGVSEEILGALVDVPAVKLLMRGSAHIRTQARLLQEEENRTGVPQDRPSPWMVAREQREYSLADKVLVLSGFAYRTFREQQFPAEKICLLPLGAEVESFRPTREVINARFRRIVAGEPLRVLYVGAVSFRKGMWDMSAIIRKLRNDSFRFRCVGPLSPEASQVVSTLRDRATFLPKIPESELPAIYAWGDVFLFPTIEDGYALVLGQAAASGLPILTTTNCAGPDLIREGKTGWVLPIRSPEAFIDRLRWCDSHREELAAMVQQIYTEFQPRDWADVAADFETLCLTSLRA